jgi:hypothetical protein
MAALLRMEGELPGEWAVSSSVGIYNPKERSEPYTPPHL